MTVPAAPLRIVQWATGTIGTRSLAAIIEHPGLDLVGVHVYDAGKVGRDAGDLCGRPPTGVAATATLDDVLALEPNCVLHMARTFDADDICALLAAGIDVVTTRGELHRPASVPDALRARVESACAAGGSSIHSTGSSPGFITEAVPLVLTSIQCRLDNLAIEESADMSQRPSPELIFDLMGFGQRPETLHDGRVAHLLGAFGPSLELVAETLGLPLDDVDATGAVAVARTTTEIAAGIIEAGTVAAQRTTVTGRRAGRALVTFTATWYCGTDLDPAWDLRPTGWRVQVEGDAPLDVELRFPFGLDRMAELSPGYTAHRAVNSVAAVHAAPPGIRTTVDLPPIIARLG